ncbi:MAG: alpha/beta hydrolase fold domain-containing protein [Planctomycetota bacterium]
MKLAKSTSVFSCSVPFAIVMATLILTPVNDANAQTKTPEKNGKSNGRTSQQEPTQRFLRFDKNNDGKLTRDELPQPLQRNFNRVDTNGDGFISPAEDAKIGNRTATDDRLKGISVDRDINYAEDNNPRHTLDVYRASDAKQGDKKLPVIVFIHGGGWQKGNKNSGANVLAPIVRTKKYVGVSIGYRLTDEAIWPAQIHDCKAAIRWIKANADQFGIDPEKIGVWGTSAGGHLVLMVGMTGDADEILEGAVGKHLDQSSRVNCVVNWFGPTDLLSMNDVPGTIDHDAPNSPESKLIGKPIQEAKALTRKASPIHYASKDDPPILTMHGDQDRLVPIGQAIKLDEALDQLKLESTFIKIKNAGHGRFQNDDVQKRVMQFFQRHLIDPKTPPVSEDTIQSGKPPASRSRK